ncbi:hypothetical protein AcW1_010058 [Taiwanofungus camphoratus]|nr:hypothetical protein AcW1_010058 [Antrodia cinnamomea]
MSIKHICENGLLVATGPPTLTYYTMSAFETTKLKRWSTIHRHSKPSLFRSYFELNRLHKFPTGTLFVFWPCAWGLTMAAYAKGLPPSKLATLIFSYFIGSTIVHSAACVINDIFDRDFDRQVERTKMRPIASGDISVFDATVFLILQITVILCMLSFVNPLAFRLSLIGIFPIHHGLYPLMKRWTNWPQAWLGLTMNWGLIVAWVAVMDSMNWNVVPVLFFGAWGWTIVYDTIYACQDKQDDVKAGIKSTALLFGNYVRPILSLFATQVVVCFAYAGHANGQGPMFFVISVMGTAAHFAWQLFTVNIDDVTDCWRKFKVRTPINSRISCHLTLDRQMETWG